MDERLKDLDPSVIEKINTIKRKYYWYAIIASVNQALNNALIAFSTSILSRVLGAVLVCINLVTSSLSGLFLANPVYRRLGFKGSQLVGMWGFTIQIICMYIAIVCQNIVTAWTISIIGATIGGITSSIWWTAQAVFLQQVGEALTAAIDSNPKNSSNTEISISKPPIADQESTKEIETRNTLTTMDVVQNEVSAIWTVMYLSTDMIVFSCLSFFPLVADISVHVMFFALPVLGIITCLLANTFESLDEHENLDPMTWMEYTTEIKAVGIQFYTDSRKTLLTFYFFAFSFAWVMFAGYLNDEVFSENLGIKALGFAVAISDFFSVSSAYVYVYYTSRYDEGLHWVMQFGTSNFIACGVLVISLNSDTLGLWPVTILLLALFGLGRGVFEGPSRSAYCKFFHGNDLATAFAGQQLLLGISGGIAIVIFNFVSREAIGSVVMVTGVIALFTYGLLMHVENLKRPLTWGELRRIVCQLTCTCRVTGNNKLKLQKPLLDKENDVNNML